MNINELKTQFGTYELHNDILNKLGYSLMDAKINLWKDPLCYTELRWDGSRNCYYNQDLDPQQRFELHQIKDLISLYEKLGTTDDLLNRNWTDL